MVEARLDFRDGLLPNGLEIGNPEGIIEARDLDEVVDALKRLDDLWREGKTAVGFIAYEAASAIEPSLRTLEPNADLPLLWFAVGDPTTPAPMTAKPPRSMRMKPALTEAAYCTQVKRIMQAIADGETYQLNFTFPLSSESLDDYDGDALYERLLRAQSANYAARLRTDDWEILSASPELFFRIEGDVIETRPMKGTRPRGHTTAEDAAIAAELRANVKERAENVMIVDLLRNDLGRIAEPGSVTVPALYELERYPTIWQMTSRVRGVLRENLDLLEILAALFPCGSVTGAPKRHTMSWIADTETEARGAYCGAIGALLPGRQAVFNVPIRTMTVFPERRLSYPVGSGIVADAKPAHEYAECLAKARVLDRAAEPCFELLETMRWSPESAFDLLELHLARIADSADYFGWEWNESEVRNQLTVAAEDWDAPMRVRLLLDRDARIEIQSVVLSPLPDLAVRLIAARIPIDANDTFLYHKTTHREVYAPAVAQIAEKGVDDVIMYNTNREITETTIGNLAVLMDGIWYTPPVSCGLLPGTQRAHEIAQGVLVERTLYLDDLQKADAVEVMNSVRGRRNAVLLKLQVL